MHVTPQISMTTCGIQPTGIAAMAMDLLQKTCNMCIHDLPDMNALIPQACGPPTLGIHIMANPSCPCYNYILHVLII